MAARRSDPGRLIHAFRSKGKWMQDVLVERDAYTPSFVMDGAGNGSLRPKRPR